MSMSMPVAAICAAVSIGAHCHIWTAGTPVPEKYVKAERCGNPKGALPSVTWTADTATWWDGKTLVVTPSLLSVRDGRVAFRIIFDTPIRVLPTNRGAHDGEFFWRGEHVSFGCD